MELIQQQLEEKLSVADDGDEKVHVEIKQEYSSPAEGTSAALIKQEVMIDPDDYSISNFNRIDVDFEMGY